VFFCDFKLKLILVSSNYISNWTGGVFVPWETLKLNAREKTLGAGDKLEDFETHFRIK
jgi:hypothetical protein